MPYASVNELPKSVKDKLKGKKLRQFKDVVNSQLAAGKSEAVAFASAWSVVQKKQIDVINDMPDDVRAKIPSRDGKQTWLSAYRRSYREGATKEVASARAWHYLEMAGYAPDEYGEWIKPGDEGSEENMFKRFLEWFKTEKALSLSDVHAETALGNDKKKKKEVEKAEYQGREVELDKPFRTPDESKKFAVYVKDGDSVKIVRFGDPDMEIKRDDPEARASFRARHKCDTQKDKTSAAYWSCKMWESGATVSDVTKEDHFEIQAEVIEKNEDERLVYGWASIIQENGQDIIDRQGDVIKSDDLVSAAHEFITEYREAKAMHKGDRIGDVVESMVFTKEVQKALGIDLGKVGWFIGMKIHDDKVWKSFRDGELQAFSIGGSAQPVEIEQE